MDWNQIGWKCKRQKKFIDFFILACLALAVLIIVLWVKLQDAEYDTMADLAAEAAVHVHWKDMHDYDVRRLQQEIAAMEETCAALELELAEYSSQN